MGDVIRMPQPAEPSKKKSPYGSAVIVEGPGLDGVGAVEAGGAGAMPPEMQQAEPAQAGAPAYQPPGRVQLAEDMEATAAQLRFATGQLVAVAAPTAQTAQLLGTYNSLLGDLASLRNRLEGATDADLLDIGQDFQSTVRAVQAYLTESGKLIGSTAASTMPSRSNKWKWALFVLIGGVVLGGGYWYFTRRKKRGLKLGSIKKALKSSNED